MEKEKVAILRVINSQLEEVITHLFNFQMGIEGIDQVTLKKLANRLDDIYDEIDTFVDFHTSV